LFSFISLVSQSSFITFLPLFFHGCKLIVCTLWIWFIAIVGVGTLRVAFIVTQPISGSFTKERRFWI